MRTPVRPPAGSPCGRRPRIGTGLVALAGCSAGGDYRRRAAGAAGHASRVGRRRRPTAGRICRGGRDGAAAQARHRSRRRPRSRPKLARRADISITVADVDAGGRPGCADRGIREGHGRRRGDLERARRTRPSAASAPSRSRCPPPLDATLDRSPGSARSTPATPPPTTSPPSTSTPRRGSKTMQASVERVRALMSQATKLSEIVALEGELTRRQADLEATQTHSRRSTTPWHWLPWRCA